MPNLFHTNSTLRKPSVGVQIRTADCHAEDLTILLSRASGITLRRI